MWSKIRVETDWKRMTEKGQIKKKSVCHASQKNEYIVHFNVTLLLENVCLSS